MKKMLKNFLEKARKNPEIQWRINEDFLNDKKYFFIQLPLFSIGENRILTISLHKKEKYDFSSFLKKIFLFKKRNNYEYVLEMQNYNYEKVKKSNSDGLFFTPLYLKQVLQDYNFDLFKNVDINKKSQNMTIEEKRSNFFLKDFISLIKKENPNIYYEDVNKKEKCLINNQEIIDFIELE